MKVLFFYRKAYSSQFSIEKVFDGIVRDIAREGVEVQKKVMPYFSSGVLPRIRNILWSGKWKSDLYHVTGDVHYIVLGLPKRKTILTIHDLNFLSNPNPVARFVLKLFWLTLPLKKVAYVTVISETTRKELLSHIIFPEDRIKIIPNYYDATFKLSPKIINKMRPRILQIGTKDNKNVLRLIVALNGIDCHLVIVGADNEKIKKSLLEYGISFSWLQNLTDTELEEQYNQCDIVSFVSLTEGFGMPILEAQAIGRVVVTSNVSSMPEVAGNAACFVDPMSVKSIREGILKVMNDDDYRETLITLGFNNIKRFEVSNIVAMYNQLYEEIYRQNI